MRVNVISVYNPIKPCYSNTNRVGFLPPAFKGAYKSTKQMLGYSNANILSPEKQITELSERDKVFLASMDLNEEEKTVFEEILKLESSSARKNIKRYGLGHMSLEETARETARSRIKSLFSYFDSEKAVLKSEIKGILNILEKGDVESSNMEMLLDLVCDRKLPPSVLFGFKNGAKMNQNAQDDLDKLYLAYSEGKDVKSVFVPSYQNEEEALETINTGDVCTIGDDKNISIKTKDGIIRKLHISPDTYLELFPPVERFAYCQSALGDCYLISAIDSAFQNPKTREKILEIFKENENGTVDACYYGFKEKDGVLVKKNDNGYVMEDIEKILKEETRKNFANMSYSCEGLRAIETLNEKTAENRAKKRIAKQAKTYIDLYAKMKNNDSVYYDGFKYTKQEIMMFLVWLYRDGEDGFISMSEKDDPLLFMHWEDINDALLELEKQGAKDDASVFQRLILERYKEHCEKKNKYGVVFKEILPKELYFTIFGQTPLNTQNMYNIGGVSSSIFSKLGLNNFSDKISSKRAKNVLFDEDCNSKYILTACGDTKITNKFGIIPHHGYSIEAFDVEGKRKFKIRNPQCSINEHILSYAELEKYFSDIDVGKI